VYYFYTVDIPHPTSVVTVPAWCTEGVLRVLRLLLPPVRPVWGKVPHLLMELHLPVAQLNVLVDVDLWNMLVDVDM
jgi:hypothetical protein